MVDVVRRPSASLRANPISFYALPCAEGMVGKNGNAFWDARLETLRRPLRAGLLRPAPLVLHVLHVAQQHALVVHVGLMHMD